MLDERSKYLRRLCLRAFKSAGKGHIGSTFSIIEILRVLYDDVAKHNPENPKWKERDRIIVSKGHGCLAQYALLADKGYFPLEELSLFCQPAGILGGHPSHHVPGIECDTGALGHGLSIGVGMAIAAKREKRNSRVFVIMGDGELQEGSVWEAAMCAGKHKLENLTVIIDSNKIQSAGFIKEVQPLEPIWKKFDSFGFRSMECNGHSITQLQHDFLLTYIYRAPKCIIADTVKGKGLSFAENNPNVHYYSKFDEEILARMEEELA